MYAFPETSAAAHADKRFNDALEFLLGKQGSDGRWVLDSSPIGRMHATVEQKGKPSKWITYDALRFIKRLGI